MFGNKKKKLEAIVRERFSDVLTQRNAFEDGMSQLEDGQKQIHTELCQITENTTNLVGNAMLNIEEESVLLQSMDDLSKELLDAANGYVQLKDAVLEQVVDITNLVEENKHYTSPAKYLTETPILLKKSCTTYERKLEELSENSRKMGIMALNAGIEANQMGESAKQFVTVAEEIHQAAINYEEEILRLKEEIITSHKKIEELEDTIHRLVSLIKEGNIATTRLLKKSQATEKMIKKSTMRDFSNDLVLMRDKVVGIRNLEEEVTKCGERNKIQLTDLQEEVLHQKKEIIELESDLSYLFDTTEEHLK